MTMKRRTFLQTSGLATMSMLVPKFLKARENINSISSNKILVVVQLSGGNDGLNTVVPYENDLYYQARPSIAIKKNEVLKLDTQLGLHPNLQGFKKLYDAGNMCLINNVGYPDPDRSHFRSTDIWQTASNSNEYLSTGWLGRYLDVVCNQCERPTHAIEIDDTLSLALKGAQVKGLAFKDPKKWYNTTTDNFFKLLSKQHSEAHEHDTAGYLYKTLSETISSASYIYNTSKIYQSSSVFPNHAFGKNLKTIAELIVSGVQTQVYYVTLTGFDTHNNQQKRQGVLLQQLADTIDVFFNDLKKSGRADDVLLMTFSEFGRRVQENASNGTDHGTANQIFLFGNKLKKQGIYNEAPNLTSLDDGDLKYTVDFRNVYATILHYWLQTNEHLILSNSPSLLNFI